MKITKNKVEKEEATIVILAKGRKNLLAKYLLRVLTETLNFKKVYIINEDSSAIKVVTTRQKMEGII